MDPSKLHLNAPLQTPHLSGIPFYQIYLGITHPIQVLQCHWIIVIRRMDSPVCDFYTCTGGTHLGRPYEHDIQPNRPFDADDCGLFAHLHPMGLLTPEKVAAFKELFTRTEPGPNQWFVTRWLWMAVQHEVVDYVPVKMLLGEALVSDPEWENLGMEFGDAEKEFFGAVAAHERGVEAQIMASEQLRRELEGCLNR
ncbi:hypothetical protein BJX61DRAFT_547373 [Aspergillus egyptiacus]|nr:hypothetical protein BJX61DRAFT_547373 [Aspergillus egyptiacus]